MSLSSGSGLHQVSFDDGETVQAKSVIIATGAHYNRLPLDRLEELEGVGVYYAATRAEAQACGTGPVAIAGGGNSAGQAALFLSRTQDTAADLRPCANYPASTTGRPGGAPGGWVTGPGPCEAGGGEERPVADDPVTLHRAKVRLAQTAAALPGRGSDRAPVAAFLPCRGLHRQEEIHVRIENRQAVASLRHSASAAREGCSAPARCERLVRQHEDVPERLHGPAVTGRTGRG